MARCEAAVTVRVSSRAWVPLTLVPPALLSRIRSRCARADPAISSERSNKTNLCLKVTYAHRATWLRLSVTVVVLAVHDVRAPWEQSHVGNSFDGFRPGVNNHHGVCRRFRKIQLLIGSIRRRRFQIHVRADLQ